MSLLNDDELNSLLQQAKGQPPEPSSQLTLRALHAYRQNVARRQSWRSFLRQPVSIPLPVAFLVSVFLLLIGALSDHTLRQPSVVVKTGNVEVPVTHAQDYSPPTTSLFKEFQLVKRIKPVHRTESSA